MSKRLLVSFSGGETSALMTRLITEKWREKYNEIIVLFANTGEENTETLDFVNQCDIHFGFNVVWVEADVMPRGIGSKHRVVTYGTASRKGNPFEAVIAKYGIPNKSFPHCTRELKENPIHSFARSKGWATSSYDTAIGIRIDEIDRMSASAKTRKLIYPLISQWPCTKGNVNDFWSKQPFRLKLKGYQGNCKWCWKKSLRKHLTIISETPAAYAFPERMEGLYPLAGSNPYGKERRFFRENMTVADLREMASKKFEPASDDTRLYQTDLLSGVQLDLGEGCMESCEIGEDYHEPAGRAALAQGGGE